jgi:hypothetical protein
MPGELGNENEGQQVGYYEHKYKPEPEFMNDDRQVQTEDDSKKTESQRDRLLRRWRTKLYQQPEPECSGIPTGGPQPGAK